MTAKLTPAAQLKLWVAGKPKCPNSNGECCPDFSCCYPKLLIPLAKRKAYVENLHNPLPRVKLICRGCGRAANDLRLGICFGCPGRKKKKK